MKHMGGENMADIEKLKEVINNSGMTMVAISKKSGILRETLYNRLSSTGDFKASEIEGLTKALRLSKKERDKIFFGNKCVIK